MRVNKALVSQNMTEPLAEVLLPNYRWLGRAAHQQHTPTEKEHRAALAKPSSKTLKAQTDAGPQRGFADRKINLRRQFLTHLMNDFQRAIVMSSLSFS